MGNLKILQVFYHNFVFRVKLEVVLKVMDILSKIERICEQKKI